MEICVTEMSGDPFHVSGVVSLSAKSARAVLSLPDMMVRLRVYNCQAMGDESEGEEEGDGDG